MASTVLPNGIIIPEKYSRDWYNDLYHNWQELDNLLGGGTPKDGTLTIQKNGDTVGTFSANQATNETINITVPDVNNGTLTIQQNGTTVDTFTANSSTDKTVNIAIPTKTSDLTNDSGFITSDNTKIPLAGSNAISGSLIPATDNSIDIGSSTKNIKALYTKGIMINGTQFVPSDYIPKTGSNAISGDLIPSTNETYRLGNSNMRYQSISGKQGEFDTIITLNNEMTIFSSSKAEPWAHGAYLSLFSEDYSGDSQRVNTFRLASTNSSSAFNYLLQGDPSGNLTWNGQSIQTISDARLKQQITEIDDKLLDAWEDVELSQFKYNDAVEQKGKDKARLHTGYVVQQIDKACKDHNVDISEYGLYCHEEYPEETEEVEVEQADGTKVKEKKVIREASEHYSLRYTEVYAVECMYLRRCIERLTARIEELEKGNNSK